MLVFWSILLKTHLTRKNNTDRYAQSSLRSDFTPLEIKYRSNMLLEKFQADRSDSSQGFIRSDKKWLFGSRNGSTFEMGGPTWKKCIERYATLRTRFAPLEITKKVFQLPGDFFCTR